MKPQEVTRSHPSELIPLRRSSLGPVTTPPLQRRRLAPDARRAELLEAARGVVAANGIDGLTLQAVADAGGVREALVRHYFGNRDGLVSTVIRTVAEELVASLLVRDDDLGLRERLTEYVTQIAQARWAHAVWARYPTGQPAADQALHDLRVRLVEAALRRRWSSLTDLERLQGSAWIGYADGAITSWFEQELQDQRLLVDALMDGANRLGFSRS